MIPDLSTKVQDPLLLDVVPPLGDPNYAAYAFVGEAPSYQELSDGEPFVGPAGTILTRILNMVGLPRHQIYLTNFCKNQLPKNDSKKLRPVWHELQAKLIKELSELKAKFIVLFGETAMQALLAEPRYDKISKFQGSFYKAEDFPHLAEPLKDKIILVTYHPASALPSRDPKNFYVIMNDLQRMLDLEQRPHLLDVTNVTHIEPSFHDAMDFLNSVSKQPTTAFDIECTPEFVTCLGFTCGLHEAMCIPFMSNKGNYFGLDQEIMLWERISEILNDPNVGKIMQNGMFDIMFILRTLGIKTNGFYFDTMLARHLAWADLSKGLDAIVSTYTYYPYYKDEGKQTHLKVIKDWPQHWAYNAKDCLYTHQVVEPLQRELEQIEALDTYKHLMELHKPLIEMEYRGIRVNYDGMLKKKAQLSRKLRAMQHGLAKIMKQPLNYKSPPQMKEYFYDKLGIKPYISRGTGKPTCDDTALKRISRAGGKGSIEARFIRKCRKLDKLIGTYFEVDIDADQRLRCAYKISGTATGRLSSAATYFGTGTNLQNQPKDFKQFLTFDPDYLGAEIDLSQAEARIVAYVSGDANMIASFESGVDCHSYNACQIFGRKITEFMEALHAADATTVKQRKLAKAVVHASNYAMGYKTFALMIEEPELKAKSLLEAYHRRFPGVRRWHRSIDQQLLKNRTLRNLYGRPKRFLGNMDYMLAKAAYAYIPQSTVAEHLNRGVVRIYDDKRFDHNGLELLATVHDSVLLQFKPRDIYQISLVLNRLIEHLDKPLYAMGREFRIPCDVKVSFTNWKDMLPLDELSPDYLESICHNIPGASDAAKNR